MSDEGGKRTFNVSSKSPERIARTYPNVRRGVGIGTHLERSRMLQPTFVRSELQSSSLARRRCETGRFSGPDASAWDRHPSSRSGVKGPAWTSIGSGATHEDARMLAEQNEQQAFPLLQGEVEIPEEQRSPSRPLSASSLQDHSRSSALNCKSELHG